MGKSSILISIFITSKADFYVYWLFLVIIIIILVWMVTFESFI